MACTGAALHSEPPVCGELPNTGNAVSSGGKGAISAGKGLWPSVLTYTSCHRPTQTHDPLQSTICGLQKM